MQRSRPPDAVMLCAARVPSETIFWFLLISSGSMSSSFSPEPLGTGDAVINQPPTLLSGRWGHHWPQELGAKQDTGHS